MSLRRQPPRPRSSARSGGMLRRIPRPTAGRRGSGRRGPRLRLPSLTSLPGLPRLPSPPRIAWLARLRPVRGGFSPTRAAAFLAILVSGGAIYGAGASDAFTLDHLDVSGLRWTDDAAVRELVAAEQGQNLVGIRTRPIAERIASLAPVAAARVEVRLPHTLLVRVTEREAVLVWRLSDGRRFLVDRSGVAFVELAEADSAPAGMPVIRDDRAAIAAELAVGGAIPAVDLDAAARLASLEPADIGSMAERLTVTVSDANGFVVGREPAGWTAIFGFYTPNLRTTELIPGQVRLLRSLLSGQEDEVALVILADDKNGTFIPKPASSPAASPAASP